VDENQKQRGVRSWAATGGVVALVANLFGCMLLALVGPVVTLGVRFGFGVIMLLVALSGVVFGFIASMTPKTRTAGVIVLLICLSLSGLWGLAMIGPAISPPANTTSE
jgi:hypothetical protein